MCFGFLLLSYFVESFIAAEFYLWKNFFGNIPGVPTVWSSLCIFFSSWLLNRYPFKITPNPRKKTHWVISSLDRQPCSSFYKAHILKKCLQIFRKLTTRRRNFSILKLGPKWKFKEIPNFAQSLATLWVWKVKAYFSLAWGKNSVRSQCTSKIKLWRRT